MARKKYLNKAFVDSIKRRGIGTPRGLHDFIALEYAAGFTGIDAYNNACDAYEYAAATGNAALKAAAKYEFEQLSGSWGVEHMKECDTQANGAGYRIYTPRK